ncbi:MAG: hypothetical protein ACKO1M_01755 [Planctomycetota bacterium]
MSSSQPSKSELAEVNADGQQVVEAASRPYAESPLTGASSESPFFLSQRSMRQLLVLCGLLVGAFNALSLVRLVLRWSELEKDMALTRWTAYRGAMVLIGAVWLAAGVFFQRIANSGLRIVEITLVAILVLLATALPELFQFMQERPSEKWPLLLWAVPTAFTGWVLVSYRRLVG